jgi:hypothetical protein
MMTVLLICHALTAVALLGAVTHQAISVWAPTRAGAGGFIARVRAVSPKSYANAIVALYLITAVLGALVYPAYRITVRIFLEQMRMGASNGLFELKEHFVVIGLAMLPAYWYFWRASASTDRTRAVLTAILAFIVWWSFIVGHILNNIRGFGS